MNKHQKHTKLIRPDGGKFHRNEWALIGAPCDTIKSLVYNINDRIGSKYRIGFADEIHEEIKSQKPSFHTTYTNNLTHSTIHHKKTVHPFSYTTFFNACDFVLVNGNHFLAARQIVIINQKKKDSLSRKLDRLANVQLVLLDTGENQVHDFLTDCINGEVPVFGINEIDKITKFLEDQLVENLPILDGLVLMGGKSSRMGQDKTKIEYHGLPQYQYTQDLLSKHTRLVYLSVNEKAFSDNEVLIKDVFIGLGPFGGILSAFLEDPNRAILSVPADTPLVDGVLIDYLIRRRNPQKIATCFHNPETNFPEPLITIWEPKAYPIMLQYLSLGYSCPRKVLINEDAEVVNCPDPWKLKNANTPEERSEIADLLKK